MLGGHLFSAALIVGHFSVAADAPCEGAPVIGMGCQADGTLDVNQLACTNAEYIAQQAELCRFGKNVSLDLKPTPGSGSNGTALVWTPDTTTAFFRCFDMDAKMLAQGMSDTVVCDPTKNFCQAVIGGVKQDQFWCADYSIQKCIEIKGQPAWMVPVLGLMLIILMTGLGATLDIKTIKRVLRKPVGVFIGMISQFLIMPAIGYGLSNIFTFHEDENRHKMIALSLIMVAATPGGSTSNMYTYFSLGNLALSVCMTTISGGLAAIFFPLWVGFYGNLIMGDSTNSQVPVVEIIKSMGLTLLPVAIGMFVRFQSKFYAIQLTQIGNQAGLLAILVILCGGLTDEKNQQMLAAAKLDVYLASLLIGFAGMFFGYMVARLATLPPRDARTVSFETGIQNVAMTVSVIAFAYGNVGYSDVVEDNTFDPCKLNDLEGLPLLYGLFISFLSPLAMLFYRYVLGAVNEDLKWDVEPEHQFLHNKRVFKGKTMPAVFTETCKHFPKRHALMAKGAKGQWVATSYDDYFKSVRCAARAFIKVGLQPGKGVSIIGFNCKQWFIADLGAIFAGGYTSGIYTTNSPEQCQYVCAHSDSQIVIVENQKQLEKFLEVRHELPQVKAVIQMWGEPSIALANEHFKTRGVEGVGAMGSVIFAGATLPMNRDDDEHPGNAFDHTFSSKHGLYSKKMSFAGEMLKPMKETQSYQETSGGGSVADPKGLSSSKARRASSANSIVAPVSGSENAKRVISREINVCVKTGVKDHSIKEGVEPHEDPMVLYSWEQFMDLGKRDDPQYAQNEAELDTRLERIRPDDTCTLIYTSGTTGPPKGVMITHNNLGHIAESCGKLIKMNPNDDIVSYLPLSHIAEQSMSLWAGVGYGCCIWFASADALKGSLVDTLKDVQPTLFMAVPRVWEKIEAKIRSVAGRPVRCYGCCSCGQCSGDLMTKLSGWAKRKGLAMGYAAQRGDKPPSGAGLAQELVFVPLKSNLGLQRCRLMATAAAPISKATLEYFMSLGMPLMEVFGMSECTGPQTMSTKHFGWKTGWVGKSIPGTEIKIFPDGEICFRGDHIMKGYYKMPQKTAETIDSDGWLHSGDIGEVDEDGFLKITDRKKDLIITAGGENVPPAIIEGQVKHISCLDQAVVYGDMQKFLVVIVTLDPLFCFKEAKRNLGIEDCSDIPSLAANETFQKYVWEKIETEVNPSLPRVQTVKRVKILPSVFQAEGEGAELTPTMKLKRKIAYKKYMPQIFALYGKDWNGDLPKSLSA